MPTYIYEHPETKQQIELKQTMTDKHEYIDKHGVKWNRVFDSPSAQIKGKPLDFRSQKDIDTYNNVYKKRYEHNISKGKIDAKTGKEK